MLNNFVFSFPTEIIFGEKSIEKLSVLLNKYKVKKVLFVYGKKSIFENGIYNSVIEQLKIIKVDFIEYGGCGQNPEKCFIDEGVNLAKLENVDFILAVGGGSVIDASKAIALLLNNDVSEGIWPYMISQKQFINNALPLGVVLTVVGTGSEGNGSFIISNKDTGDKLGKSHLSTRPVFSICDPIYTLTLGKWQTACGCADIMSHLLEQYFCLEQDTNLSDDLIIATLKNVIFYSKLINDNPNNLEARSNLMLSSTLSLSYLFSLGKTLDWSVHKIEHAISGLYDIPHGAGLSCILPAWLWCFSDNIYISKKIIILGKELGLNKQGISKKELISKTIIYIENIFIGLKLPIKLSNLINGNIDIKKIIDLVLKNGDIGIVCPIDNLKCIEILNKAY